MSQPPRPHGDQGELVIEGQESFLAALVDQMHRNWALGDNAANDELVVQIRDHIRRHQAVAQRCSAVAFEEGAECVRSWGWLGTVVDYDIDNDG